jgi:hypothetical protein
MTKGELARNRRGALRGRTTVVLLLRQTSKQQRTGSGCVRRQVDSFPLRDGRRKFSQAAPHSSLSRPLCGIRILPLPALFPFPPPASSPSFFPLLWTPNNSAVIVLSSPPTDGRARRTPRRSPPCRPSPPFIHFSPSFERGFCPPGRGRRRGKDSDDNDGKRARYEREEREEYNRQRL